MRKTIFLFLIIFILLPALVLAAFDIQIEVKDSFSLKEILFFNYSIYSDTTKTITFTPYINCPNTPLPLVRQEIINLKNGESYTDTYVGITITENIESQTCTAYVQILSPLQQRVEEKFEIKTNPSFSFDINLDKKIFIKGEDIYLDYISEVLDPTIMVALTYPNKKQEQIILPYQFKAEQIGTYELEVTASKEGYKTIIKKEQFGVIEKEANIPYFNEDRHRVTKNYKKILVIIGFIILLIIIIFSYWWYKKTKLLKKGLKK